MTEEQIKTYEYCKKHLAQISSWRDNAKYNKQMYGQGSGSPKIEHQLAGIHKKMGYDMDSAMTAARVSIQKIIEDL